MVQGETVIRVRYQETDQMGVAYHANFLVWFELGRTELMRRLGLPYLEFEENDLFLPVIKATCEYKAPARYDDELRVITRLEKLHAVRLTFTYEVRRQGTLLARGCTEHAVVNKKGRPVVLKKWSPSLWERLCNAVES